VTPWWTALAVAYLLAGTLAFAPGLGAGLVSDSFAFLEMTRAASWDGVVRWFVPRPSLFYRPLYLVMLRSAQHVFGLDPVGYHLVAWLAHVLGALALAGVAMSVTRDRITAATAGLAFLWSIHAHEVVYDVASLHHAIGGLLLLLGLLAWTRGRRGLSVLAVGVGLFVNELAMLAAPILCWYELCFGAGTLRSRVAHGARRLAPHAALVLGYFVFRIGLARAGLPSEGATCLGLHCLAIAAAEYANRLVLRPESLLAHAWSQRAALALASTVSAATVAGLLWPWAWRRPVAGGFAAGWTLIGVAYVVLTLFPYVADRFLYAADMGLSLLVGCLVGEAVRAWPGASRGRRLSAAIALGALAAWVGAGAVMLRHRGALWSSAGSEAARIVADIHAAAPEPPMDALFCVHDRPDTYHVVVAPGNSGPYVFRNGLSAALRIRYARSDLRAPRNCPTGYATVRISEGRASVKIEDPR
jgi:hypothetical protein